MQDTADMDLLRRYVDLDSQEAFATLVKRYVNLVYSAALRKTGSPDAAGEITQAVFIILARKAATLRRETVLSAWLYQTARLTAANHLRTEIRRTRREQEAFMQSLSDQSPAPAWPHIAPLLEDAMGRLGEKDRNAIALRFFEGRDFHDIGRRLGTGQDAAKMRVSRALEKLRKFFAKRGVTLSAAAIAGAMAAHSVQAAPAALASTTIVAATAKGSLAATSTLTLAQKTMKTMTWMKIKLAASLGAAVLFAGGAVTVALSQNPPAAGGTNGTVPPQKQILVAATFFKVPTAGIDSVINDFGSSKILANPGSQQFRTLLRKHPEINLLGVPRVLTSSGRDAQLSTAAPNPPIPGSSYAGLSFDVTPTYLPGGQINLKLHSELRETTGNADQPVRTIAEDRTATVALGKFPLVIRKDLATDGLNPDDQGKTLLIFVNAMTVQQRLQKIIQKAP